MGVLKIYQKLSKMEFYKNALVIRRMLTDWLKRDFGLKSRATSIDDLFKEIPDCDDRENLVRIFKKYGIDNKIYIERVPNWYLDSQKKYLLELCRELVTNIVAANVLNPKFIKEHIERRLYQDRAIAVCAKLLEELYSIKYDFDVDLNGLVDIIEKIDFESILIDAWRYSDYKSNKKLIAEASVITTASNFANVNNNGNANNNGASNTDGAVRPI